MKTIKKNTIRLNDEELDTLNRLLDDYRYNRLYPMCENKLGGKIVKNREWFSKVISLMARIPIKF